MQSLSRVLIGFSILSSLCFTTSCVQNPTSPSNDISAPPPSDTSASALGLTDLTDDQSRSQLFANIQSAYTADDPKGAAEAVKYFDLYGPFRFPNDVDFDSTLNKPREDSLFGVDISHYTSNAFPIEQLRARKVLFVYMKATQGATSLDSKFASFWARAGRLPEGSQVHRGAYHFLSSGDPSMPPAQWGRAQAATFVKVIKANGGLLSTDMPPVVDLEWDKAGTNTPDRWRSRTPDEILAMLNAYLATVKDELGRTPVVYTARAWWIERMGSEDRFKALADYPLWLADYSKSSRASEAPKSINGSPWTLWQYTESATMAIGFGGSFDASVFKGKPDAFYSSLGVAQFKQ